MPRDGVTIINKSCVYVKFTKETVLDTTGKIKRFHVLDFSNQFLTKAECIIPQRIRVYYNEVSMSDKWKTDAKKVFLGIDGINGDDLWYKENKQKFDELVPIVPDLTHLCNIYHCDKCIYSGNFDYDEGGMIKFHLDLNLLIISKTNEIFRFVFNGEAKDMYKWIVLNSKFRFPVFFANKETKDEEYIEIQNYDYERDNDKEFNITYNNDIVENNDGSVSVYFKSDYQIKSITGKRDIFMNIYTPIGVFQQQDIKYLTLGPPDKYVILEGIGEITNNITTLRITKESQLFGENNNYILNTPNEAKQAGADRDYILVARYGLNKKEDPGFAKFLLN